MNFLRYIIGSVLFALSLGAFAAPASAQATRTWLSGVGDDANPCSRTAPCKTFAGAISKTAAGGEMNCLDPGSFGPVTITKSITIDCSGTFGGVAASSSTGVIINGTSIDVVLRGITYLGGPSNSAGNYGVRFLAGGSLTMEDCQIQGFQQGAPVGSGIFVANTAGTVEIFISRSTIANNRDKGIMIAPTGTGGAKVVIENSKLLNNGVGVRADTSGTSGRIDLSITDTVIAGNTNSAMVAIGGTGAIIAVAEGVTATSNGSHGIRASGASVNFFLGNTTIASNLIGTEVDAGATLNSYGDNRINGNTTNGPALTVVAEK